MTSPEAEANRPQPKAPSLVTTNFRKWVDSVVSLNDQLSLVAKPVQEFRDQVQLAVSPITSAGSQAKEISKSLELGVLNIGKYWDFVSSGSLFLNPPVSPSMIDSAVRDRFSALFVTQLPEIQKQARAAEKELAKEMTEEDAARDFQDYQESIENANILSAGLDTMAREIAKRKRSLTNRISGIRTDMISHWAETLKENLQNIKAKIGQSLAGLVGTLAQKSIDALSDLRTKVAKGFDELAVAFKKLCGFIETLFVKIISGLFDFVRRIQSLAKTKKFTLKEVTLEIEGAGVEITTIAGFPIPIPKIKPPKISLKFWPPD